MYRGDYMLIISGMIIYINIFLSIKALGLVEIDNKNQWAKMLLLGSFVVGVSYFIPDFSMLILVASLLIFLLIEKNSILNSLVSILVIVFVITILDVIIGSIIIKILEYSNVDEMFGLIARIIKDLILMVVTILFARIANRFILRLKETGFDVTNIIKGKITSIFGCVAIIAIFIINIFVIKDSQTRYNFYVLIVTFAISYLIIGGIIVFVIYKNIKSEMGSKAREKELKTLTEYNENLEALYNDMRKFRHDYVNILSSMAGYIEDKDMGGLKEYFNKKIVPLGTNMNENNSKIGLLHNIRIKEIKGVIITKIIQAQELGIEVIIDIAEIIDRVNLDVIDLSRCIGILLDNAIEAAVLCEKSRLEIGFIKKNNSFMIVIVNSISEGVPPIHKIFEKGFSTKGENRGLGLSNLREILSKYQKASLDTIIENKEFRQILEIN
jgi:two-component system sensor histidine kinase AgrC